MAVEILNNGSAHDSYEVDRVVSKLNDLTAKGLGGLLLLVDLHRLSVPHHPKVGRIIASQKADLRTRGLLEDDERPSQLVKDVVISSTLGDDMTLVYTGSPYAQPNSPSERAGVTDPNLASLLDIVAKKKLDL